MVLIHSHHFSHQPIDTHCMFVLKAAPKTHV
jgi:hypothetical protein